MRIALDAHGGDFGLRPNLEGALAAAKKLNHELLLVGRDPEIREELHRLGAGPLEKLERIKVVHASQVVDMAAEPVEECRSKPDSSLMVGAELVRDGKADAFISAGNSAGPMGSARALFARQVAAGPGITTTFRGTGGMSKSRRKNR